MTDISSYPTAHEIERQQSDRAENLCKEAESTLQPVRKVWCDWSKEELPVFQTKEVENFLRERKHRLGEYPHPNDSWVLSIEFEMGEHVKCVLPTDGMISSFFPILVCDLPRRAEPAHGLLGIPLK